MVAETQGPLIFLTEYGLYRSHLHLPRLPRLIRSNTLLDLTQDYHAEWQTGKWQWGIKWMFKWISINK